MILGRFEEIFFKDCIFLLEEKRKNVWIHSIFNSFWRSPTRTEESVSAIELSFWTTTPLFPIMDEFMKEKLQIEDFRFMIKCTSFYVIIHGFLSDF